MRDAPKDNLKQGRVSSFYRIPAFFWSVFGVYSLLHRS